MTKTKRQLRAEAAERLRNFDSSDDGEGYYWDITLSLLGKRPTEYENSDELLMELVDLLSDDEIPVNSVFKLEDSKMNIDKYREIHFEYSESFGETHKSINVETYLTNGELIDLCRELNAELG